MFRKREKFKKNIQRRNIANTMLSAHTIDKHTKQKVLVLLVFGYLAKQAITEIGKLDYETIARKQERNMLMRMRWQANVHLKWLEYS